MKIKKVHSKKRHTGFRLNSDVKSGVGSGFWDNLKSFWQGIPGIGNLFK